MSFVFRGAETDLESGLPGFLPGRRTLRIHGARPVKTNSLAFLVTVVMLCLILSSNQMSPNFLLWLVLGVFLMATILRMYVTCQQLQAQAQAQAQAHHVATNNFYGHTELRLQMPPSVALATTRGRLQGLRLQLSLLDREFDDLDYETLRALDSDNVSTAPSMSEDEINALPLHKYKVTALRSDGSSSQHGSSSSTPVEMKGDANAKGCDDELTCSICLDVVNGGELVRSLPCLHQFHTNCIHPWLQQQGTCPVCKLRVASHWQQNGEHQAAVTTDTV